MIVLALELSTVRASIAIHNDEAPLATASWEEPQARHQRVFEETPRLLAEAGVDWPQIDLFAVGRGPGAFSGIRIGLMAAQMYAIPLGRRVVAVSSGEALAAEVGQDRVLVCGDARRGMFWYGLRANGRLECWRICRVDEWAAVCQQAAVALIVTSQWERVAPLRAATPEGLHWEAADRYPTAAGVARLALAGEASEPLVPIYLHPPV